MAKQPPIPNDDPTDTFRPGVWCAVALVALYLALFVGSEHYGLPVLGLVLFHLLPVLLLALIILVAATAAGLTFLGVTRLAPDRLADKLLCAAGIGLGLTALATLGLGLVGFLRPVCFIVLACVAAVCGWGYVRETIAQLRTELSTQKPRTDFFTKTLWAGLILLALINALGAFTPPWEYDVQEYHLGAPAQFFRAGRVFFLKDNVYANFPENVEMLYLLGMVLSGSKLTGAFVGKMLNVFFGLLAGLALYSAAQRIFGKRAGLAAAVFFYSCPAVTMLSGVAYVEMSLIFYLNLALSAFLTYCTAKNDAESPPLRPLLLCAIATGLAAGCKYPALLFLLVPVCVGIAVHRAAGRKLT